MTNTIILSKICQKIGILTLFVLRYNVLSWQLWDTRYLSNWHDCPCTSKWQRAMMFCRKTDIALTFLFLQKAHC